MTTITPQTGVALHLDGATNDGTAPPRSRAGAPSAAPSTISPVLGAVPPIALKHGPYRITATVRGRTLACAVLNTFGWHLPTSTKGEPLTWTSHDDRIDAAIAVYGLAMRRLHGN